MIGIHKRPRHLISAILRTLRVGEENLGIGLERSAIRIPAHQLAAVGIRQSAEIYIVRSDLHETLHTGLLNQKRISPYRCG